MHRRWLSELHESVCLHLAWQLTRMTSSCTNHRALLPLLPCLLEQATYQQQQAALEQQRQTDAALERLAEAEEDARQDAWIACMLVELMGSSLITPPHTAAVRVPTPVIAVNQPTDDVAAPNTGVTGSGCEDQHQSQASGQWCMWDRGYSFAEGGSSRSSSSGGSTQPPGSSFDGSSSSGGCSSAGVLDLLNACISYPQFVEVLLCLMAGRSVSILEPDVKQIRPLSLDEEMEVGVGWLVPLDEWVPSYCWHGHGSGGACCLPESGAGGAQVGGVLTALSASLRLVDCVCFLV